MAKRAIRYEDVDDVIAAAAKAKNEQGELLGPGTRTSGTASAR